MSAAPAPTPSGVVTFLFTDVEGSTRRWEADADGMRAALAIHDEVLRAAIEAHGGYLFKHTGDGVCAAFGSPRSAVDAAVAAQRGLELPVRMGIATGEAELREADYFGTVLNRAARVMAAGHGGQILVAESTAGLLTEMDLVDLGPRRLRDLPNPVVVFQVRAAGLRREFPPLRTLDATSGNLRLAVTSFIGRDSEVTEVQTAISAHRLLTLTGVGGVGKTRLAFESAARIGKQFSDGVWICELASLDGGAAVSHAVAAALRLQQRQGLGIDATVIEYLQARELLLVVDNCEHVLEAAAGLVDQIVRHCPRVSVLATSREALGIEGERILPVPPLPVEDATVLFVDRAKAGRPDFDLEREPVGTVSEICRRLDGLPLAIELAAARMRVMSSLDVARRLDRLRVLSGGARGAPARQQSVAATVDWSYRLLAEPEQSLFTRLSVFAGGFDLDAAHAVCGEHGATEDDTLELLTSLVDKSMVTVHIGGAGRSRYEMLETLRAYGRDRLREKGIDDRYASRHANYFTELAERAAAGMHGADEQVWVERMLPDYDNLRAAFERAMADGNIDVALRLVTSSVELAHLRVGYEAASWAERILEVADRDNPLYPAAVGLSARGAWNRGEFDRARSLALLAEGRVPGRGTGRVAYPADVLADLDLYEGHAAAALAYYDDEVMRARCGADPIRLVWDLFYVAICHAVLRTPEVGLPAAEESLQVADATANPTARSMARYALGLVLKKSEPDRALSLFDEAAELAASVQNFWWYGIALMEAAATRGVHGDPATAARLFIDVLDHWDRVGDWSQQWLNLRYATRLLIRLGAVGDAIAVHHALVKAGRPSPMSEAQVAELSDGLDDRVQSVVPTGGVAAAARARTALSRY
ncbi:MAG: ATP-binding protein [Candidatus Sericytochromatia bacterium]